MNGVEKYENEPTETIEDEEHRTSGKPIVYARPWMKSTRTRTPVSVPLHERKCMDVNMGSYDHECYVISTAMIRLPRHEPNIPWETDGAFAMVTQRLGFLWEMEDGGTNKRFQNCLNPNSARHISYLRAIQGHSRNIVLHPELQENVLVPKGFTEYIYHVGNAN